MLNVWRLNIKTGASEGIDPRMFCIENNILGVGWPVEIEGDVDWDTYYKLGEAAYYKKGDKGWWPALNIIKNRMKIDDLCWTRDMNGIYYLGKITSGWIYHRDRKYQEADVVNIRECLWQRAGAVDSVPGKVVNSFIPSRTVQKVDNKSVVLYSKYLFNSLSQHVHYTLPNESPDLFSLISSGDLEDLIGIFLQDQGYRIIPSSCKSDTPAYEFVLKHAETGKPAVVQVKQGNVNLNIESYSKLPYEVYLLTSHGKYVGKASPNVHCIDPKELKSFAFKRKIAMSDRLQTWIKFVEQMDKDSSSKSEVFIGSSS